MKKEQTEPYDKDHPTGGKEGSSFFAQEPHRGLQGGSSVLTDKKEKKNAGEPSSLHRAERRKMQTASLKGGLEGRVTWRTGRG